MVESSSLPSPVPFDPTAPYTRTKKMFHYTACQTHRDPSAVTMSSASSVHLPWRQVVDLLKDGNSINSLLRQNPFVSTDALSRAKDIECNGLVYGVHLVPPAKEGPTSVSRGPCVNVPLLSYFRVEYSASEDGHCEEADCPESAKIRMMSVPIEDPFIYSPKDTPDDAKNSFLRELPPLDSSVPSSLIAEITVARDSLDQFTTVAVVASMQLNDSPDKATVTRQKTVKQMILKTKVGLLSSDVPILSRSSQTIGCTDREGITMSLSMQILSYVTALPLTLHSLYANYQAFDTAVFENFQRNCLDTNLPAIRAHEVDLVNSVLGFQDQSRIKTHGSWSLVSSHLTSTIESFTGPKPYDGSEPWTKTVAEVDAPFGKCTAWCWENCSAARSLRHERDNGKLLKTHGASSGRSRFDASVSRATPGLPNRLHFTWSVWMKSLDMDAYFVAFAPVQEYGESSSLDSVNEEVLSCSGKVQLVMKRGCYIIERLAENVSRVTLISQTKYCDAAFPSWVKKKLDFVESDLLREWQAVCMRRDSDVDAEIRREAKLPPEYDELSDGQKRAVDDTVGAVEDMTKGVKWLAVREISPYETSHTYYDHVTGLTTCRTSLVIDTDPLMILAFISAFCSRKQMNLSREDGDPVRAILERRGSNDIVVVEVKEMPFWIRSRIYRSRMISFQRYGEYVLVSCPVSTDVWSPKVENTTNTRAFVEAQTKVVIRITRHGACDKISKVVMHQVLPLSHHIPKWMSRRYEIKIPFGTRFLVQARNEFARDKEIDLISIAARSSAVVASTASYSKSELKQLEKALCLIDEINGSKLRNLASPDVNVFISYCKLEHDPLFTGKATTTVNASISDCHAWETNKLSRENLKLGFDYGGLERNIIVINEHSFIYRCVYQTPIPGFLPREFITQCLWLWGKGARGRKKFLSCYDSCSHPDFPVMDRKFVRAFCRGFVIYEELEPIGDLPQTYVTYLQQVDVKGVVPKSYQNTAIVSNMLYVSDMRRFFSNPSNIEDAEDKMTIKMLNKRNEYRYDDEEKAVLNKGKEFLGIFKDETVKERTVRTIGGVIRNSTAYKAHGELEGEWSRSETVIRATKEAILSFLWSMNSKHHWINSEIERRVLEAKSPRRHITYTCSTGFYESIIYVHPRETVNDCVWAEHDDSSFLFVSIPTTHGDAGLKADCEGSGNTFGFLNRPIEKTISPVSAGRELTREPSHTQMLESQPRMSAAGRISERIATLSRRKRNQERVMAYSKTAVVIKDIGNGVCKVVCVSHHDYGGKTSSFSMGKFLHHYGALVLRTRYHFEEARELKDYEYEDGTVLGIRLRRGAGTEKRPGMVIRNRWELVEDVVEAHRGLRTMREMHPWIVIFLQEVVKGKLRFGRSIESPLQGLSFMEAKIIGGSLMAALRQRKTPEAGVYQWKIQNRAVGELFEKYPWTEGMILAISQNILNTEPWGVVWRVCTGAVLSLLDVGSDLSVVSLYLAEDAQRRYGLALLAMISVNLIFQWIICFVQNARNPKEFFLDSLVVLIGLKPAYDAFRVTTSKVNKLGIMDAKMEMIISKSAEMVCESIPGCVLQAVAFFALLRQGVVSKRAIFSIVISALTAGFTAATISYDVDSDPARRRKNPLFYGYIPDKPVKRTLMFICMVLCSSMMLVIRCMTAAMLIMVDRKYFLWYTLMDQSLYLVQKVLRGDFYYHLRIYGIQGLFLSFIIRVFQKFLADYTFIFHFRSAQELGGIYFSISTVQVIVVAFGSLTLLGRKFEDKNLLGQLQFWMSSSVFVWSVLLAILIYSMKKGYRSTFFSFETGAGETRSLFLNAPDDAIKSLIFKKNKHQWKSIREDVRLWLVSGWSYFEDMKPEWFDESFLNLLDEDMLPREKNKERLSASIAENRKSGRAAVLKDFIKYGEELKTERPGTLDSDQIQSIEKKRRNSMTAAFSANQIVAVQQ